MKSVMIHDLLEMRILVSRETARSIEPKVAAAFSEADGEVFLDFTGVEGISPSFLDETLSVIEDCGLAVEQGHIQVVLKNTPALSSEKFAAVARGHDLQIITSEIGDWIISRNGDITECEVR